MRNKMMSSVWLINTLENTLHEPNCLLKEILEDNTLEYLTYRGLNEEEQAFADQELKRLQMRIGMTMKLLKELELYTKRVVENRSLESPIVKYINKSFTDKAI